MSSLSAERAGQRGRVQIRPLCLSGISPYLRGERIGKKLLIEKSPKNC